jgi:acetylcholinesterase
LVAGTILTLGTLNLTTHDHVDAWVKSTWFPDLPDADRQHMLSLYPEDVTAGSPFDTGYFNRLTPQNKRISALIGSVPFLSPSLVLVTDEDMQ